MSREQAEQRLDAMLAALRAPPAPLDEIAQARVRARIEAALPNADAAAAARTLRGWRSRAAPGVALAAAAAVLAVIIIRSAHRPAADRIAAPPSPRPAPIAHVAPGAATSPIPGAAAGTATAVAAGSSAAAPLTAPDATTPVTVAAGESAQLTVDGAAVTVYGPGRLSATPDGAVVEAAGIVVDRTHGSTPWSMRYHGVKIVAMNATFAVDHGAELRVSVMRGEIVLGCPSGSRTVRAGGSASCEPAAKPRAAPPIEPGGAPPAGPRAAAPAEPLAPPPPRPRAPVRRPEAGAAGPSSVVESTLPGGFRNATREALLAIVNASPDSLDAATALLDLARLAASRGDPSAALDYLDRLDRHPRHAALAAPALRLRATLAASAAIQTLETSEPDHLQLTPDDAIQTPLSR